jgi:hypothetical protein
MGSRAPNQPAVFRNSVSDIIGSIQHLKIKQCMEVQFLPPTPLIVNYIYVGVT